MTIFAALVATVLVMTACGTTNPTSPSDPAIDMTESGSAGPSSEQSALASPSEEPSAPPTSSQETSASAGASPDAAFDDPQECENDELGYEVEYPGDWWANDDIEGPYSSADIEECTYFARQEVEIQPASEIPVDVAIWFSEQRSDAPESQGEVISRDETTVDGHDAIVIEYEPPVGGFSPEGTVIYKYLISTDDGLLAATTNAYGHEDDYEDNKEILDAMMETVEFDD